MQSFPSSSQQKLNIVDRFNRDRRWWCRTTENCREINENYTLGHTILAYRRIGRRPSPLLAGKNKKNAPNQFFNTKLFFFLFPIIRCVVVGLLISCSWIRTGIRAFAW